MNFDAVWELAKRHPYAVGGSILALVLLLWYLMRGSGTAAAPASGVYAETQDPNVVAANAAIGIAQNQDNAAVTLGLAQMTSNDTELTTQANAATTINGQNTTASIAIAGLAQALGIHTSDNALAAIKSNNATAAQIDATNMGAATTVALAQNAAALQLGSAQAEDTLQLEQSKLTTQYAISTQAPSTVH